MKLLITTGIFPPDVGGPATYVPRIAGELTQNDWDVEVLTSGTEESNREFPFPVRRIPGEFPARLWSGWGVLRRSIRRADRVYVNGLELDRYLSGRGCSTPVVQKIVGDRSWERYRNQNRGQLDIDSYQSSLPPPLSWLERTIQRMIARDARRIIVPSKYLESIVHQWGVSPSRTRVVHNTAHPPETVPDQPVEWPGNGLKLLTAGRLVPWKRTPGLIRRVGEVPGAGLVVLGDGPRMESCVETVRAEGLERRVRLAGNVSQQRVWQHLNHCDLFLLHSTYEGFPHVLLEAMATGTPVVVSGSGGSRELASFFPDRMRVYSPDRPNELTEILRNGEYPKRFEPPKFPEPLQWDTIAASTARVLENAGEAPGS